MNKKMIINLSKKFENEQKSKYGKKFVEDVLEET